MSVGDCDLFLTGSGWVWVSVTLFRLDVGECGLYLVGCKWVCVGECDLFFGCVWVGVGECDLFLAGCGWVWVRVWVSGGGCE